MIRPYRFTHSFFDPVMDHILRMINRQLYSKNITIVLLRNEDWYSMYNAALLKNITLFAACRQIMINDMNVFPCISNYDLWYFYFWIKHLFLLNVKQLMLMSSHKDIQIYWTSYCVLRYNQLCMIHNLIHIKVILSSFRLNCQQSLRKFAASVGCSQ